MNPTNDTNIINIHKLPSPTELITEYPLDTQNLYFINNSRKIIQNILTNQDDRLLVIIGPCSIHDYQLAIDYAQYIKVFQNDNPNLYIVMRVYFEKPRSRHGWKGFIYDPDLNDTFNINKGLELARKLLLELTKLEIPIGCEFLDTITPQYLADLVSWGAIGARTSESQIHRQLASGLSMPIGFKNLTDGDYKKAIDGILSAQFAHHFLGIDYNGNACHISTKGNPISHLILRGGKQPNYYQEDLQEITKELKKENINTGIIIDCSHGNSQKEYFKQVLVACSINKLMTLNKYNIRGVMIESHINLGSQKLQLNKPLKYGVSITDGCIDIVTSNTVLMILNNRRITQNFDNINDLRSYLYYFENPIIKFNNNDYSDNLDNYKNNISNLLTDNVQCPNSNIIINFDDDIFNITRNPLVMCFIHKRLSTSELVADIKFHLHPYEFMLKNNDFYKLVTDRNIEKGILQRINSDYKLDNLEHNYDLFIKIMELSKRIQAKYLEKLIPRQKIGYLGNHATFSYEVLSNNFNGLHTSCDSIEDIYTKLHNNIIHFGLIPTYNSLVGSIFTIPNNFKVVGNIDYKIKLALFANNNSVTLKNMRTLYVQEVVYKEAKEYIVNNIGNSEIVTCTTTEESCLRCIQDKNSMTIASINNQCNFLQLIDSDIVDHNVTTFSLIKKI